MKETWNNLYHISPVATCYLRLSIAKSLRDKIFKAYNFKLLQLTTLLRVISFIILYMKSTNSYLENNVLFSTEMLHFFVSAIWHLMQHFLLFMNENGQEEDEDKNSIDILASMMRSLWPFLFLYFIFYLTGNWIVFPNHIGVDAITFRCLSIPNWTNVNR